MQIDRNGREVMMSDSHIDQPSGETAGQDPLTEQAYRELLTHFLFQYWGAFHEALEAQSVTPTRLAGSLFENLCEAHRRFAALYQGPGTAIVAALGRMWDGLQARRYIQPDPPFRRDEAVRARDYFRQLHHQLIEDGSAYPAVTGDVVRQAPHGTPLDPLRADAAS
jgi:hypothetical protein